MSRSQMLPNGKILPFQNQRNQLEKIWRGRNKSNTIKEKSLMIVFFKFSYPAETNSDSTLKYTGEQTQIMYAE